MLIRYAIKFPPAIITPRTSLHFLAVSLILCGVAWVHISAMDDSLIGQHQKVDSSSSPRESDDKHSALDRERRAVKKNATPKQDFEKRLKVMEERRVTKRVPLLFRKLIEFGLGLQPD